MSDAPVTPDDVRAAYRWLVSVGVEPNPRHSNEAAIVEAATAIAEAMADDHITAGELHAAVRRYVRKPMGHGGKRPCPDLGHLVDCVMDARVAARPTYGAIADHVRRVINRHYSDRSKGWDTTGLPPAVASMVVEALVAARVSHRGDEPAQYVQRDVEREYEARRVRR